VLHSVAGEFSFALPLLSLSLLLLLLSGIFVRFGGGSMIILTRMCACLFILQNADNMCVKSVTTEGEVKEAGWKLYRKVILAQRLRHCSNPLKPGGVIYQSVQ
jgi:hypothetical protein